MTDLLSRIEAGEPVEAQEVFDFAVSKVIEQGAPAISERGCLYRAPHGRKCALGHLIPDSLYNDSFEDVTAEGLLLSDEKYYCAALAVSLARYIDLIRDMQETHDGAAKDTESVADFLDDFRHRAEAVAKYHGLTFNF